jgi:N-acetylneuraminic acid mutarotase
MIKFKTEKNNEEILPRNNHTSIIHQNDIYFYGGSDDTLPAVYDDFIKYNMVNKEWTRIETPEINGFDFSRMGHSCTVYNDKIYFFFGFNFSFVENILIYDILKNQFTIIDIYLSFAFRYYHSSVLYKDKIYIYGGFDYSEVKLTN